MNSARKAAIQAYKEQKLARGIYAVRCQPTGRVWVDSAMDLRAAENRIWFALKLSDVHLDHSLAADFSTHGREGFTYEILEKLDDDVAQLSLRDLLKERAAHWMEKLGAGRVSPN